MSNLELIFYWTSNTWTLDGTKLTTAIRVDFDKRVYHKSVSPAIPNGLNAVAVKAKFDLDGLERYLAYNNFKALS